MANHKDENERHDRSGCQECGRVFWGVRGFDVHRPCGETEMRGKFIVEDDLYILKGDITLYRQIKEHMKKVRKSRGL